MNDERPLVIAHRGASGSRPENTAAAFREALRIGARTLECDVRLTRDGAPVILHDERLARTTSGQGLVRETTLSEIRGLSAGYAARFGERFAAERVLTLEEFLSVAGPGAGLLIELKLDAEDRARAELLVRAVVDQIDASREGREVALISFDRGLLTEARRVAPRTTRGLLVAPGDEPGSVEAARNLDARFLIPARDRLEARLAEAAHTAGLLLATYVVDTPEDLEVLRPFRLAAFATDYPERFIGHPGVRFA